jgi:hypothetical protein
MSPLRILVTGSRNWRDQALIREALLSALGEFTTIGPPILVHGGQMSRDAATGECYGADYLADQVWRDLARERPGWLQKPEVHPARWELGHHAGPARNSEMVKLGATVVLAFPLDGSRGTWDCVGKARAAGIPVRIVTAEKGQTA